MTNGTEEKTVMETGDGKMLSMPAMPDLWHKESLCVTHSDLCGALACWAVRQSPYSVPDNLAEGITEFWETWPRGDYATMGSAGLLTTIKKTIAACPTIVAWNTPRSGHGHVSASRHDKPDPDHDFIDLGALARNIAHDLILRAQVEEAQEKARP